MRIRLPHDSLGGTVLAGLALTAALYLVARLVLAGGPG
jgi:hypothetical protein